MQYIIALLCGGLERDKRDERLPVPAGKQTPAAADHSKIPEGKLEIADMSHMYTVGQ